MTPGWWNRYAVHVSARRLNAAMISPKRIESFGNALPSIVVCRLGSQKHHTPPISTARRNEFVWSNPNQNERATVVPALGANTNTVRDVLRIVICVSCAGKAPALASSAKSKRFLKSALCVGSTVEQLLQSGQNGLGRHPIGVADCL